MISSTNTTQTHPIVFFDGVCAMCNQTVNLIMRHDKSGDIRFAPLQGTTARQALDSSEIKALGSIVVVDEQGIHRKSTAVCRLLLRLGGVWKLLGGLLWLIPYPLRDLGYSVIAHYRYRLFGKHETCRLPTDEERSRFLE
jgi:predicted DCC family thiol-disulfide oxidoreductase YuxK